MTSMPYGSATRESQEAKDPPFADRRDVALAASEPQRHARPRLGEFDYKGRFAYHLVGVTHERTLLLRDGVATDVVEAIEEAAKRESFEVLVYCVMPDHVHVLAMGTSDHSDAIRFVQRFKQSSGYSFKQHTGRQLWQQSFFDHVVRGDEDLLPIARYILGNPVEAGLVRDEVDWEFTGGTMVESGRATALHSLGERIR